MKKGEVFFSALGVVLFSILFVGSLVLSNGVQNSSEAKELAQQFIADENVTEVTSDQVITYLGSGLLYIGVISLICAVLGVISLVLLHRKDKSRMAGKLLITTAILGTILTLLVGVVGCCAYLIASIIANGRERNVRISA